MSISFGSSWDKMMRCLENIFSAMYLMQGNIQSFFRPGDWLPIIRNLHCQEEKWIFSEPSCVENKELILGSLMNIIGQDRSGQTWRMDLIDTSEEDNGRAFIRLFVFTKLKWLDIIEIDVRTEEAMVKSFSSGFLPLCIPLACFLNVFFFWVPFFDMGLNKRRLRTIVQAMGDHVLRVEER